MQRQVLFKRFQDERREVHQHLLLSSSLRTSNLTSFIHTFCEEHWVLRQKQFPPLILQVKMLRVRVKIALQYINVCLPRKRTKKRKNSPDVAVRWNPRSGRTAPAENPVPAGGQLWVKTCSREGLREFISLGVRTWHWYSHSTTVSSWCWLGVNSFRYPSSAGPSYGDSALNTQFKHVPKVYSKEGAAVPTSTNVNSCKVFSCFQDIKWRLFPVNIAECF